MNVSGVLVILFSLSTGVAWPQFPLQSNQNHSAEPQYSPYSTPYSNPYPAQTPVYPLPVQATTTSSSPFLPPGQEGIPNTGQTPVILPPINFPPPSFSMPGGFPATPDSRQPEPPSYAESLHAKKSDAVLSAEEEVRKFEAIEQARKNHGNTPVWMLPLPDSRGPFLARLENQSKTSSVVPVSHMDFEMYDKTLEQNKDAYSWEKDDDKGFDWMLLDPVTFYNKSKEWIGLGPDQKKAEAAMEEGRKLMSDGQFAAAGKKFEAAAKRWPDTVLEEDARYFAGECYFQAKIYYRAYENFDRLISEFQSKHKNTAVARLYEIGGYWVKKTEEGAGYFNATDKSRPSFDTFGAAEKAYKSIIFNDTRGPYYDRSMLQLGFAYMNQGKKQGDSQYEQAANWFRQLRENAINHEYASRASYLEVHCRKMAVDGAEYDSSHLLEAKELADQTLTQFGPNLKDNRENLVQMRNEIGEKEAEHYWTLAQYYEKGKHYGAARMQYQHILKEHPTTNYAQQAEQRIEAIKDHPDSPPALTAQVKSLFTGEGKKKKVR